MIQGTILMHSDNTLRKQALWPTKSFIIRAPAGSGKTSLLIERFLHLLNGHVNHPSEIFALTFTIKACKEMQERILTALNTPNELTNSILKIDKKLNWNIKNNPQLLNIMTIDALANQIHHSSNSDLANAKLTSNALSLYQEACECFLYETTHQQSINELTKGLDFDTQKLITLLITLLEKREQWIPYLTSANKLTEVLTANIQTIQNHMLEVCINTLPTQSLPQWSSLIETVISGIQNTEISTKELIEKPSFSTWKSLANWILTAKGEFKRRLTKNEGFKPEHKPLKAIANEWIDLCKSFELQKHLKTIKMAPCYHELNNCNHFYQALATVLPELCAHLHLVMQKHQTIDFIEMNLRSSSILSEHAHESFHLDNRIQHLLIDEYQDTSNTHAKLIKQITQVWETGKTIFIVGDPMQSIYRFRQADVRLYLKAFESGLDSIDLNPITLTSNYRSSACIVDFNNHIFASIFPKRIDYNSASVPFSKALPQKQEEGSINIHEYTSNTHLGNAVAEWINKTELSGSTAILARTRMQLSEIASALNNAEVKYQGIELTPLINEPIIQDLITINQALSDLSNRTAWLALLRMPCIGLRWQDIYTLSQKDSPFLIEGIMDAAELSEDGQTRVKFLLNALLPLLEIPVLYNQHKRILEAAARLKLESCHPKEQQVFATKFFEICQQINEQNAWDTLESNLANAWGSFETSLSIQLMTVHKSKGLEFDNILVTHLDKSTQKDPTPLIFWDDYHTSQTSLPLIFPGHVGKKNADFMKDLSKQKLIAENQRLLYVALTRCKHNLHLWMPKETSSTKNSWDNWIRQALTSFPKENVIYHEHIDSQPNSSKQFQAELLTVRQPIPSQVEVTHNPPINTKINTYQSGQLFGTLVHDAFQFTEVKEGIDTVTSLINRIERKMKAHRLTDSDLLKWNKLQQSLVSDPYISWLFESKTCLKEYPITYTSSQGLKSVRIDRLIIENDKIWIIDIKTQDTDKLDNVEYETYLQHKNQLEIYSNIIESMNMSSNNIYCAIYYPINAQCIYWQKSSASPKHLYLQPLSLP